MNEKSIITLVDRSSVKVTGMNKIISMDVTHFSLDTSLGELVIYGKDLIMDKLDSDNRELFITGDIKQIAYEEIKTPKESFLKKLFKWSTLNYINFL